MKRGCLKDVGSPAYLAMMCEACEKNEAYVPTEWFSHVWFLHSLQRAGFPFAADDLTLDEWLALGELRGELDLTKVGADGK